MKKNLLSVIVPIYNVEVFLPRCLDSLLRQGLQDGEYEIICVNDGSPDQCGEILANYKARYPNLFHIITQTNQGLGAARNTGMAVARGEYITFVDSDDYVLSEAYSFVLSHFINSEGSDTLSNGTDLNTDVLCFGYNYINTDGKTTPRTGLASLGEVIFDGDGAEAFSQRLISPHVWTKFYRREFLERYGIKSENTCSQDELFNFEVFRHHPHTRIISTIVYQYEFGNDNSIQRNSDKKRVIKQLDDQCHNIRLILPYLINDDNMVKASALRSINHFLKILYNKMLFIFLPWKRWRNIRNFLKTIPAYQPTLINNTWQAKYLAIIKKWTGRSYLIYLFIFFLRNFIFAKYLRPLILQRTKKLQ